MAHPSWRWQQNPISSCGTLPQTPSFEIAELHHDSHVFLIELVSVWATWAVRSCSCAPQCRMVPGKSLQWETKKITWAPSQSVHLDAAIRPAGLASVAAASVGAVPHLVASGGVEAQAGSGDSQYQMVALQPVAIGGRMKGTCRIARVQLPGELLTWSLMLSLHEDEVFLRRRLTIPDRRVCDARLTHPMPSHQSRRCHNVMRASV